MSKQPKTHAYLADALPGDLNDKVPCTCGLPKVNRAHEVPAATPEQQAADAARLGEHTSATEGDDDA